MDSFPNLPKPAVAESPPARGDEPVQVPLNYGIEADAGEFVTDADLMESFLDERNPLPGIVLAVGVTLCYLISAGYGFYAGGAQSAITMAIMLSVMLTVACATATAVGWVVCKIFGDDIGSAGTLLLRFSSVASFQMAVFSGFTLAMGFFPAAIISAPLLVAIVVFIGGLDMLRAIVFSVILSLLNFMLISFFAVGALSAIMPA